MGTESLGVESEPKRRSFRIVIITVVAIVVVIVAAALAYMWWSPQGEAPQDGCQTDWYFIEAYAEYVGEAPYLFETMTLSMRMEVVDLNSTHLKSLFHMKMASESLGTILDEQETNWVSIKEETSFGLEEMEGYTLERTFEDRVYIEGVGNRYCRVYEFTSDVEEGIMAVIIYIDTSIVWPLKFSFQMNYLDVDINLDITLTDTNIPALT
jgi:hypothetical protein